MLVMFYSWVLAVRTCAKDAPGDDRRVRASSYEPGNRAEFCCLFIWKISQFKTKMGKIDTLVTCILTNFILVPRRLFR